METKQYSHIEKRISKLMVDLYHYDEVTDTIPAKQLIDRIESIAAYYTSHRPPPAELTKLYNNWLATIRPERLNIRFTVSILTNTAVFKQFLPAWQYAKKAAATDLIQHPVKGSVEQWIAPLDRTTVSTSKRKPHNNTNSLTPASRRKAAINNLKQSRQKQSSTSKQHKLGHHVPW